MEARVVHLQLLVALTAQRLWALNLHTKKYSQHKISARDLIHHMLSVTQQ